MIIDVTGFGWSGSGAVHDLLREYSDVKFAAFDFDLEFTLLWEPDGLYDLEHKLCHKHCRYTDSAYAIKRFLTLTEAQSHTPFLHYDTVFSGNYYEICKRFVDSLIQFSFEGRTFEEVMFPSKKEKLFAPYNRIVRRLLGNHISINVLHGDYSQKFVRENRHKILVSYNPDGFMEKAHQFIDELFSYVRSDKNIPLVTDQLFPPDCPDMFFKYIEEPVKCIIVRRDPRDTYLLAKKAYNSGIPLPVDNVDDFITFYRKTIEETRVNESGQILNIQFENVIYEYDKTVDKIENFLGIKAHDKIKRFFDPQKSINNTQLYNMYDEYSKDVKKIEELLPESLFHFEKYPKLGKNRNKVF